MAKNGEDKVMEAREFQTEIIKIQLVSVPGTLALGFGVYGIFGANGNAFIDLLNNRDVCLTLIAAGAATMVWEFAAVYRLIRRRQHVQKEG